MDAKIKQVDMTTISLNDNFKEIQVFIPYNKSLLNLIHSIPGRQWNKDKKCWHIPRTPAALNQLKNLFSGHKIEIPSSLNELLVKDPSGKSCPETGRRVTLKDRRTIPRSPFTDRRASNLVDERKISATRTNQVVSAIKFLYGELYGKKVIANDLCRPHPDGILPKVLNHDDIIAIINKASSPKHKLALQLAYSYPKLSA